MDKTVPRRDVHPRANTSLATRKAGVSGWIGRISTSMFHTKVRHPDHTEYQHYEDRWLSARLQESRRLRIPQGVIRYDLNPEFIEKLNWIDWEATKAQAWRKIKQIIAQMKQGSSL